MMDRAEHRELQLEIPDYVTARADDETRRRLEAHLPGCEDCADLVATGRTLWAAGGEGAGDLLEPHPAASSLMAWGLGEAEDAGGRLARHVASCAACRLEVEVWRRQGSAPGFGLPAAPRETRVAGRASRATRFARYRFAAAAAVAGVLLGVGLGGWLGGGGPGVGPGGEARPWSGAVPLTVLERPLRGEQAAVEVRVAARQPYVPLAVAPVLPSAAPDDARFVFSVVDGSGAEVWSTAMTASEIREPLDTAGVVTFLVPAPTIPAGGYRLLLLPEVPPGAPPLLEVRFDVVVAVDTAD